jgi:hypothetical protein
MQSASISRPAPVARATPIGTGHLHQALEAARHLKALNDFCSAHVCTTADVSADGKRLNMPKVFALMRSRGYTVSDPKRSNQQPRPGQTLWLVSITFPDGIAAQLGFYTPNTS